MVRTAIVTGASQGIGASTAIRLAQDFSAVVLVARNTDKLEATASRIRDAGAEPLVVAADLSDPTAAAFVVDHALTTFGSIDALANIAGAVPQIDLFDMTDEQWDAGMALKLHGARRLTLAAWPALKLAKGSVVLMSGNAADLPRASAAAVATINAAIVALAKAFADRGIEDGVQVNSVLPGPVITERRRAFFERWAPQNGLTIAEAEVAFPKQAGISRLGEPGEIADLIAFLLSPAAKWMTGSAVRIDGGEVKTI